MLGVKHISTSDVTPFWKRGSDVIICDWLARRVELNAIVGKQLEIVNKTLKVSVAIGLDFLLHRLKVHRALDDPEVRKRVLRVVLHNRDFKDLVPVALAQGCQRVPGQSRGKESRG